MSEFGNPSVMIDPPNQAPPTSESINIADEDISELAQQAKLNSERIKLFHCAVISAIIAFFALIILFCCVVGFYLYMTKSNPQETLSSNFWHIPLMIAVMATSILYATLKLSASFGENKEQNKGQNENISLLNDLPIWRDIIDAIKSLKSSG